MMTAKPFRGCYWVSRGRLLAGEYPRDKDRASEAKVKALRKYGFTVFVDLTHPLDKMRPYEHMLVEGEHYFNFPIIDVSAPRSPRDMRNILDTIDYHLKHGHRVYVHCWGGVGRTGTVIGCWLARHGAGGMAAFNCLQDLWKSNPKSRWRQCPDTPRQKQYIINWEEPKVDDIKRFNGCLMGLAVGDAVGTTVEFSRPGAFEPVTDMTGGGPFNLKPGEWTDDTSMALCLAQSLLAKGFDPKDQMGMYCRWCNDGVLSSTGRCFDIGGTTSQALAKYTRTGNPYAGSTAPSSSGNGSLMRLAPVAMYYAEDPAKAIEMCGESSKTTHGSKMCVDACRFFGGLLVGALKGAAKDELLASRYSPVVGQWGKGQLDPLVEHIAEGSYKGKEPPQIVGSGFVVESLEAALWAFHKSTNFKEGCLLAVNLGNDADTTAAIYGQLAGAFYGLKGIPPKWRGKIKYREMIAKTSHSLFYAREGRKQ